MNEIAEERALPIRRDIVSQALDERSGETTIFTCPECGGTLWQIEADDVTQFNCHVGHTYSPDLLLGQMSEELEATLWACVRMFTEKATLTRQLARRHRVEGRTALAARSEEQARYDDRHGQLIREALLGAPAAPYAQPAAVKQSPEGGDGEPASHA